MHYLLQKIKSERGNLLSIGTTSLVSVVASFVMMLAFANLLDQQTLGIYQYIIATASIIGAFSFTGMGIAIIRAVSKQSYSFLLIARRYLWYGSIIPVTIGAVVAGYYAYKTNYELALGILFSVICIVIIQVLMRYNSLYVAIEQFKASNYLLKAHALAPVIFVLPALFFMQHAGLLAVLYFGGSLVAVFFSALLLKMPQQEKALISKQASQSIDDAAKKINSFYVRFATHQSVIKFLYTIAIHLDKILIFQMLGAQETAMYFIAVSIPDRLRSLIKQFEPYLFSKVAKHSAHASATNMRVKITSMLVLVLPFFILYISLVPLFFNLFLPNYTNVIHLAMLYGITLFASVMIIPESILRAHSGNRIFYNLSTQFIVIKTILLFTGIYFLGLLGAIIAATLSMFMYTLVHYVAAKQIT